MIIFSYFEVELQVSNILKKSRAENEFPNSSW